MLALSHIDTTLSNEFGDCDVYSLSRYDLANAVNTGAYNYDEFIQTASCNTTADPIMLGYDPYLDGEQFSMQIDVRTLVDSVAVNFDLLLLDGLQTVRDSGIYTFNHNDWTYIGQYYIDPWYPGTDIYI